MISFLIIYFAIFIGVSFRKNMISEYNDSIDYQHKYRKCFQYYGDRGDKINVGFGEGEDVIVCADKPNYPFVEGHFQAAEREEKGSWFCLA